MLKSSSLIIKNISFNFLSYIIPLGFALFAIPILIKNLGAEKFGILNIVWMIIGYFSLFDFGLGKGLTKIISEKISMGKDEEIPEIFWSTILFLGVISILLSLSMFPFIDNIIYKLNITASLQKESRNIMHLLIISIPFIATTVGFRGLVEAYQKFKLVSIFRSAMGAISFLLPLVGLFIFKSLISIVILLTAARIILWLIYFITCIKINTKLFKFVFDFNSIKPIIKFSIWITIANIIGPIILYSDKFFIGMILSASALTYYVTPYDVISKLLLLPIAITGVLFPVFSSTIHKNRYYSIKILIVSMKFIFILVFPISFLFVAFSKELLSIWLGQTFAKESYIVLQFFSIGIFMNCISSISNNFLQGIGKPKIPTIINLIELPLYLIFMWVGIKNWGINGAAFVYMIAAAFDANIMSFMAFYIVERKFIKKKYFITVSGLILIFSVYYLIDEILIKFLFSLFVIIFFGFFSWKYIINPDEKTLIIGKIRPIIQKI